MPPSPPQSQRLGPQLTISVFLFFFLFFILHCNTCVLLDQVMSKYQRIYKKKQPSELEPESLDETKRGTFALVLPRMIIYLLIYRTCRVCRAFMACGRGDS